LPTAYFRTAASVNGSDIVGLLGNERVTEVGCYAVLPGHTIRD